MDITKRKRERPCHDINDIRKKEAILLIFAHYFTFLQHIQKFGDRIG
jgi:hypothetical protein